MAKLQFIGDHKKYGVTKNLKFDGEFHTQGTIVFVEGPTFSNVHPSISDFLDSYRFLDHEHGIKRVRKHTDLDNTRWFTTGEAAEFLGVSVATIRNYLYRGTLRSGHRVGGRYRILRVDCVELLASMREEGL